MISVNEREQILKIFIQYVIILNIAKFYLVSSTLVFCTSMVKGMLMKGSTPEMWSLRIPFIVACVTYVLLYFSIFNYKFVVAAIGAKAFAVVIGFVIAFPIAITNIIPASMFADLAQYDTILTGENRAGMFFTARNFANKLCQAVVVIVYSLLLGRGMAGTGAATAEGVRMTALVATAFVLAAVIIYCFYDDKTIMDAIRKDNEKKISTGEETVSFRNHNKLNGISPVEGGGNAIFPESYCELIL